MRSELTIIIPAYNEASRISGVVRKVTEIGRTELDAFEIIVVDDGSKDGTYSAVKTLKSCTPELRVLKQEANQGVGAAYAKALHKARMGNVTLIPGDDAFGRDGIRRLFRAVGSADLIITYRVNPSARTPLRRLLSVVCNQLLRLTSRCALRDGHSLFVWPVPWAREVDVPPDYRYHMVSLLALLRRARTYRETPADLTPQPDANSRVMRFKVVWRLGVLMVTALFRSLASPPSQRPRRIDEPETETAPGLRKIA